MDGSMTKLPSVMMTGMPVQMPVISGGLPGSPKAGLWH